jgi:hypothetical protein
MKCPLSAGQPHQVSAVPVVTVPLQPQPYRADQGARASGGADRRTAPVSLL